VAIRVLTIIGLIDLRGGTMSWIPFSLGIFIFVFVYRIAWVLDHHVGIKWWIGFVFSIIFILIGSMSVMAGTFPEGPHTSNLVGFQVGTLVLASILLTYLRWKPTAKEERRAYPSLQFPNDNHYGS